MPDALDALSSPQVDTLKAGVATAGALLLLLGVALRRAGRPRLLRRARAALLLALGVAGALGGFNLLRFHYGKYVHLSDTFHHYVGGKYFPELGYTRLYECTWLADEQARPRRRPTHRRLRSLSTYDVETADAILADPGRCTRHFEPARWRAFRRDVRWFRNRMDAPRWDRLRLDHGFNASPAWLVLGRPLAETGPAAANLPWLTLLDPLLLLVAAGCVGWAFGLPALAVAAIYWGTNYFARFEWTGGSFLRQDWLACSLVGLCLLRRGRPTAAGFLLGWAALVRAFPVAILAGVALEAAAESVAARRVVVTPDQRRLAAGCALAAAVALPLSALASGGLCAWPAFVANTRLHVSEPLTNHVGLATLLAYDPQGVVRVTQDASLQDPYAPWQRARQQAFARRAPLFAVLVLAFTVLVAWAARGREDWVAGVLGIGLAPVALSLTSYYWAILAPFALLGALGPRQRGVGAALCGLAALSWAVASRFQWQDEVCTWNSLAGVAFVCFATLWTGLGERPLTRRA